MRMSLTLCQRHKMDGVFVCWFFFFGLKPNFCSVYCVESIGQIEYKMCKHSIYCNVVGDFIDVCMCAAACVRLMAWIKCNHSSKQRVSDLNLHCLACLKQSAFLFCAQAACKTGAEKENVCENASVRFQLNKTHIHSHYLPRCSVNSDLTCIQFLIQKKKTQVSYMRWSWTQLESCKWKYWDKSDIWEQMGWDRKPLLEGIELTKGHWSYLVGITIMKLLIQCTDLK